jgi:hypothetical protein
MGRSIAAVGIQVLDSSNMGERKCGAFCFLQLEEAHGAFVVCRWKVMLFAAFVSIPKE